MRSSGIRTEKTTMVFRKLDNSKDDYYQKLIWKFRLLVELIESRNNIYRTLSSVDIAVVFTTILTARYQIRFFSGSILDHTVKSAWLVIFKIVEELHSCLYENWIFENLWRKQSDWRIIFIWKQPGSNLFSF